MTTTAEAIDLNIHFSEDEDRFRADAYPVVNGSTNTNRELYSFPIPEALQGQCRREFNEDDWVGLDEAPGWLSELVHQYTA